MIKTFVFDVRGYRDLSAHVDKTVNDYLNDVGFPVQEVKSAVTDDMMVVVVRTMIPS